jgi:hypothetical protein
MGTWGVAIFGNDTAADVRDGFRELIEDGRSDEEATSEVLRKFGESLADPDDAPFVWTALAAVQHRLGRLQPSVRERAIQVIDSGAGLHLWDDEKLREKRKAVLLKLRGELLGPARERVAVRRPRRKRSPVQKGQVFLLRLPNGQKARFRVVGIDETRQGDWPIVDLIDDHGRVFQETGEWLKGKWKRAQYELLSPRFKDLPAPEDVEVVGMDRTEPSLIFDRGYLMWSTLRDSLTALLDDPTRMRVR